VARARLAAVAALLAVLVLAPPSGAASATGEQRVLIILGTSGAQPYSVADVQSVARSAAEFYRTSSFSKLDLHFDVTPWLKAFTSDPGCGFTSQSTLDQLMLPARLAAQRAGYAPAGYPRLVYIIADSHCAFYGTTYGQEVTLTRAPNLELLLHELGHSFGLGHSRASRCVEGCNVADPGDPFSPMGTGDKLVDFSAYEKVVLGWLPPQPHVTKAGLYTIVPSSRASGGAHAIVVDREAVQWWIEYNAKPFRGLLVRYVDVRHPVPPFADAPVLIVDPVHRGRDWVALGETYRSAKYFTVRLVRAGAAHAQVRLRFVGS